MANIHFVCQGTNRLKDLSAYDILNDESPRRILLSYENTNKISKLENVLSCFDGQCNVIIDSGAFAVYNSGKKINIKDYSLFIKDVLKLKSSHQFRFVNLDVIGDYVATEKNYKMLNDMGLDVCPVLSVGDDISKINIFKDAKTVFVGGIFQPKDVPKKVKLAWLDRFYGYMLKNFDHDNFPKTHLLAVTNEKLLMRYPAYSCDSSHWMSVFRFGYGNKEARLPSVPRRITDETMPTLKHILREHVRHFIKIETTTNKLWQSRGITYAR